MTISLQESLTAEIVFEKFTKKIPRHGYKKEEIEEVFKNSAFYENPCRYVLEKFIDDVYFPFSDGLLPYLPLMKGIPHFNKITSPVLLKEIAERKFKNHDQFEKIMEVFNASVYSEEFKMNYIYFKYETNLPKLNHLLKGLFYHSERLEKFLEIKKYLLEHESYFD